jgi:hypothetical protein
MLSLDRDFHGFMVKGTDVFHLITLFQSLSLCDYLSAAHLNGLRAFMAYLCRDIDHHFRDLSGLIYSDLLPENKCLLAISYSYVCFMYWLA